MFGRKNDGEPDFHMYACYDSKAELYRDPMFAQNDELIVREFANTFRDPNQTMNLYFLNAEDFALFRVGSYFRKTGTIVPCAPQHVRNLHEIKAALKAPGALTLT